MTKTATIPAKELSLENQLIAQEFIKQKGRNITKAVAKIRPDLPYESQRVKGSRLLTSDNFVQTVRRISEEKGLSLEKFIEILTRKVLDEDHAKHDVYCEKIMRVNAWEGQQKAKEAQTGPNEEGLQTLIYQQINLTMNAPKELPLETPIDIENEEEKTP